MHPERRGIITSPEFERTPRVAVVLLHHGLVGNGGESLKYTEQCLHSLESIIYPNFEIVILDSGSTDDFSKRYKEAFSTAFPKLPKVTLLHLEENVGCAEGYNIAAEHAIKEGAEYLFLLNNDVVVLDGDILSNLVKVAERSPQVAAVGPKIYYWEEEEPEVLQFVGGRFHYRVIGAGQIDKGQFNREMVVDFLSGAAMLVRADVIREVGLFDPRFFIYLEELDFAARAKSAGYEFIYTPDARVRHKGRHSIDGRYEPPYVDQSARNYAYLIKKHEGDQRLKFLIRGALVVGKSSLGILFIKKRPKELKRLIKAVKEGWKW